MKVVVFGHSHTDAIKAAAKGIDGICVFREQSASHAGMTAKAIGKIARGSLLVLATGGNHHSGLATVDTVRVPYRVMGDYFRHTVRNRERPFLRRFKEYDRVQLIPPPPKKDAKLISQWLEMKGISGQVADPEYRLMAWKAHRTALSKVARKMGAFVLPPPPEAVDADGFLKPEYYAPDTTHANRAYGALQVARLLDLAANWEASSPVSGGPADDAD